MEKKYPNLFSPIKVRSLVFKNRIISSPLGAWVFSPDNYTFDYAISMFEEKAKGGAAAICVGHTEVNYKDPDSDGFGLYFDLRKNEGTNALTIFAEAVQQYGCHASIELNYGGLSMGPPGGDGPSPEGMDGPPGEGRGPGEGPGGPPDGGGPGPVGDNVSYDLNMGGTPEGRVKPLTKERIKEIIGYYSTCVRKMQTVGFHMVTIHGAHGWMPAKFLSPKTNRRTDEYGGSFENRMRFPLELMQAVREAAGNKMVVEYRISGVDPEVDPVGFEEQVEFLKRLEGLADIIHISSGDMSDGGVHTFPSYLSPRGVNRKVAAALKKRVPNIPFAVVGAISQPEMAEEIIANGEADFVAMCRTLIADPQWPNKARRGQDDDIRPCIACYNCLDKMHKTHFLGCDINPRCGMEHRVPEVGTAAVKKNVVVVGGGPAGMQAAITACDRGHEVTLIEKTDALGGLLKISDGSRIKWMLNNFKNYLVRQVEKRSIKVMLNTEATSELIQSLGADTVLVASGSDPIVPPIPGVDGDNVFTCVQAHKNQDKLGDRIVLIGGGMVGCEEALDLKDKGKKEVTVVEMTNRVHADAGMVDTELGAKLKEYEVNILINARCTKIAPDGVAVEIHGREEFIPCDTVVLAVGMRSNYGVYESLLDSAVDVYPIGDSLQASTVRNATRTAFYTALNI